jgi:hypothetical protein
VGLEIGEGNYAESGPNIVGEIPKEMEAAGAIVAAGGDGVVGTAIFFVVETDVNGAAEFGKIAIEIAEEKFDVAAEEVIVFVGEVALGAVGFHVFCAEHADGPLKFGTAEGKILRDDEEEARFS